MSDPHDEGLARAKANHERMKANVPEEPIEGDDACEVCNGWGEILQNDGSYELCITCDATGRAPS